ncbi:TetR/AcrR family transcriptional regulator [Leptospira saintgironsiae]|uniref:HTH tetR-type domain-containing protein n=1 Tax=Leptospira saintgironsiae TaxID=2023183 RepID=A0A2M9YEK5_9LEPT|nr:TetR/AcrR family transcriptional regulator [Leptospira saintgironsiae]PJZ49866.1 hypothetical protein CH362_05950 [Leptospira saintgironsiae]
MGHSQTNKSESREKILRAAADRFREFGVNGIGLDALMKEAGLTHGGFYRHFSSREELVGEAIEKALQDGSRNVQDTVSRGKELSLEGLVDAYLSKRHRDNLASSCAVTSLSADTIRSNEHGRSAYTRQVKAYLDLLNGLIEKKEGSEEKVVLALSTLVGALSISRAVNDPKLSREILKTTAKELKSYLQS